MKTMNFKTAALFGAAISVGAYAGSRLADSGNPEPAMSKSGEVMSPAVQNIKWTTQTHVARINTPLVVGKASPIQVMDCVVSYGSWGGEWLDTLKKEAPLGCFEVEHFDHQKTMVAPNGRMFSVRNAWNAWHYKEQIGDFISQQRAAWTFQPSENTCIIRSQSYYDPEYKTIVRKETYWISNTCGKI